MSFEVKITPKKDNKKAARLSGGICMVEYMGLEPMTSSLPARRSSQLS